jgi:hypothetical protein
LPRLELIDQQIEAMLNSPETLEGRGCLSPGSALQLRQIVRDAIPMRPGFDLYNAYGYRPGGLGLDLKPGVRLKVQRAHFSGPAHTITDLIGASTVYYECRLDARGRVGFGGPEVQIDSPKLEALRARGWEDTRFAREARPAAIYRLFLLTSFLKKGLRRSALVLGAPSVTAMRAMERKIAADPSIGCGELGALCISFEGDVSVSAEVQVTINGAASYVDWGADVRAVLRKFPDVKPESVRLRRLFQGKLVPVEVDGALGAGALEITALVAGDELRW